MDLPPVGWLLDTVMTMRLKIITAVCAVGLIATGCSGEGSAADKAPEPALLPNKLPKPAPLPEEEPPTASDAPFNENMERELRRKTRRMASAAGDVTAQCPKELGSKSVTQATCTSTYNDLTLTWDIYIGDASSWSDSVVNYEATPRKVLLTRDGVLRLVYGNFSADEVRCNDIPEAVLLDWRQAQATNYQCQVVYKEKGAMSPDKYKATDDGPSQVF